MCRGEISESAFRARFAESLEDRVPGLGPKLAGFLEDGLLERSADAYAVTPVGCLFLRVIASVFDAYLPPTDSAQPAFSKAV